MKLNYYLITIVISVGCIYLMWGPLGLLDWCSFKDRQSLGVAFHGVFLDALIFGLFFTLYERNRIKRDELNNALKNIDDFRSADNDVIRFRVISDIKKCIDLGKSNLNLVNYKLDKAILSNLKFKNSDFSYCKLNSASLKNVTFQSCDLSNAELTRASLDGAQFIESKLINTDLRNVDLSVISTVERCDIDGIKVNKDQIIILNKKFNLKINE